MLYDPSTTWNKQAWDVDNVVSVLMAENRVKNFIVVGIWNGGKTQHQDYFPQKPFEKLSQAEKDTITARLKRVGRTEGAFQPQSDNYLKIYCKRT